MFKQKTKIPLMWYGRLRSAILRLSGKTENREQRTTGRATLVVLRSLFFLVALTGVLLYTRAGMPARVEAATSETLNFQARLLNGSGSIVADGNYHVEFKLYNHASSGGQAQGTCSGNCLWSETYTTGNLVTVKNGYLSVQLGSIDSLADESINWDQDLYLTMRIGGAGGAASWDTEMAPRLKLTAVPYAFRAGGITKYNGTQSGNLSFDTVANSPDILLPDITGTNTVLLQSGTDLFDQGSIVFTGANGLLTEDNANFFFDGTNHTLGVGTTRSGAIDGTGNARLLVKGSGNTSATSSLNVVNSSDATLLFVRDDGNVGIGTTSPGARLQVDAATSGVGVVIRANATTPGNTLEIQDSLGVSLGGFNSAGELFLRDPTTGFTATLVVEGNTIDNDVEFRLPDIDSGVATICTSANNCVGVGGAGDVYNGGQPTGTLTIGTDEAEHFYLQTDDTNRVQISNTGVVSILSGNLEVGVPSSVTGSLTLYNSGNANAAIIQTTALTQPTTFTLPDVNFATAEICVKYDTNSTNCAGSGSSVTQNGTNDTGQIAYFTSSNNITSSSSFFFDADTGFLGVGTNTPSGRITLAGDATANAWGTSGIQLQVASGTYIDDSTAASGTAADAVFNSFAAPILAATNASVTTTNAATVYIQGPPTAGANQTITNAYALWVDAGTVRFDDNVILGDAAGDALTITGTNIATPNDLNFNNGNLYLDQSLSSIGINTTAPSRALDINSATGENLRLIYNDADGSAANYADFLMGSTGTLTIQAIGTDSDIELNTENFDNAIYIDDSADRVGIGTATPAATLDVNGTLQVADLATLNGGLSLNRTLTVDSGGTQSVGSINFTTPVDTTGTNVSNGLNITPIISNATGGTNTANVINIGSIVGDADVDLNAVLIGSLTGSGADEYAINIGAGWDSILRVGGNEVINGAGQIVAAQITGTLFNFDTDTGSPQAVAQNATITIQGGSTGIDVEHSGDTITVDFDGTEVNDETFGDEGGAFTWIFDATTGTDVQLGFADDELTVTAADTILTGNLDVATGLAVGSDGVIDDATFLGGGTIDNVFALGQTFTDLTTTDVVAGSTNSILLNPSEPATAITIGTYGAVRVQSGNAEAVGNLYGSYFLVDHLGDGDAESITGVQSFVTHDGAGNIGVLTAANLNVDNDSGTVEDAIVLTVNEITGSGITNAVGGFFANQAQGTNNVNLALGGFSATGNYSIYNASTYDNLFGGKLIFDQTDGLVDITSGNDQDLIVVADGTGNLILDTETTGSISIGTNNDKTITIGSATGTSEVALLGGNGANAVSIQSGALGTISIGTAAGGLINVGTGAFAHIISIGTDATTSQTISMGSAFSASTTTIQGGTGANAVSIQAATGGTINIGTAADGSINIGTGNFNNTIVLGNNNAATLIGVNDTTPDAKFDIDATFTPATTGSTSNTGSGLNVSNTVNKTAGTDTTVGQDIVVVRTGASGGTINTTGVNINVTGDAGGTSRVVGLNVNVSGADTNIAAVFQGGNVGIGTALPGEELDVVGDIQASNRFYVPAASGTTARGYFTGNATTPLAGLQSLDLAGTTTISFFANNKYFNGTTWVDNGLGRTGSSFQIQNDSFTYYSFDTGIAATARFIIASGGNVGIGGDLSPDALLSVGSASQFQVNTNGDITTTVNTSEALNINTGNHNAGVSGAIGLQSGTGTTSTGAVTIATGNASAGTAGNISIDNGTSTSGTPQINIGTGAFAHAITIGSTTGTGTTTLQAGSGSLIFGSSVAQFSEVTGTRTLTVQTRTTNVAGTALTVSGGTAGAGASAFTGGLLTLQGGNAGGTGNANGANVLLRGGTGVGTGVSGIVEIDTPVFTASSTQAFGSNGSISQAIVDGNSTIPVNATAGSLTITLPAPTITTVGRIIYVTSVTGSNAFTIAPSGGTNFVMNANMTGTFVWNGSGWTNAGVDGGSASYIQNQTAVSQVANFRINGVGRAATFDADVAGVLNLGTSTATSIQLGNTTGVTGISLDTTTSGSVNIANSAHTHTVNIATGAAAQAVNIGSTNSTSTVTINTGTGNVNGDVNIADSAVAGKRVDIGSVTNSQTSAINIATASGHAQTIQVGGNFTNGGSNAGSTVKIQGGTVGLDFNSSDTGGATLQSFTNDANTFRILDQSNGVVLQVDTNNSTKRVFVGVGATAQLSTSALVVTNAEVNTRLLIGTATNGISLDVGASAGQQFRLLGNARNNRSVVLAPEFAGAVLTGVGGSNIGTMTSDYCSGSSARNINASFCAASNEHNFYQWTTTQGSAQNYDVYVRWIVPSDFDSADSASFTLSASGFRSSSNESVQVSVFDATDGGTPCANNVTITSINGWNDNVAVSTSGCSFAANDMVVFRVRLTATNSNFARIGELGITYKSVF